MSSELPHQFHSAASVGPPLHAFEAERLDAVRRAARVVTPGDDLLSNIACQAADSCGTPIGVVSFMHADEERYISCSGVGFLNIERAHAFCAHTILQPDVLAVEDTLRDPRFRENPFVVGEPHVRLYAGAPILDWSGLPLGGLCVVGFQPREISSKCLLGLRSFARMASIVIEARLLLQEPHGRHADERSQRALTDRLNALLLPLVDPKSMVA